MIISFEIENWMSFKNPVKFFMTASKERQHGERVPRSARYRTRILPVAAIYGGNASGKTNFFKALNFSKNLVVYGTRPYSIIPTEPFRLDDAGMRLPSRFVFELLIDETVYEFSFSVSREAVLEEKLTLISTSSEKTLYHRYDGKPHFHSSLAEDDFLQFVFKGTRENQLFLTNSVSQRDDRFRPIYDWFRNSLVMIAPDARFRSFENFLDEDCPLYDRMNQTLRRLDTGIERLWGDETPVENVPIAEADRIKLLEEMKDGQTVRVTDGQFRERYAITSRNGELTAKKLVTYHYGAGGGEIKFEMHQESDGTLRVIDLLPAFLDLSAGDSKKTYVIDEIDRSLHTLLTRRLLEDYLETCSGQTRSQLLFTTHDALLMDQELLRRDEMWVTERGEYGVSTLFSLNEYKEIRYDKDIRKSYLQGRLGGIPRFLMNCAASDPLFPRVSENKD